MYWKFGYLNEVLATTKIFFTNNDDNAFTQLPEHWRAKICTAYTVSHYTIQPLEGENVIQHYPHTHFRKFLHLKSLLGEIVRTPSSLPFPSLPLSESALRSNAVASLLHLLLLINASGLPETRTQTLAFNHAELAGTSPTRAQSRSGPTRSGGSSPVQSGVPRGC